MRKKILIFFILSCSYLKCQDSIDQIKKDSITSLDEVIIKSNTILGSKFVAKNRTGAAYYL